jgi:hypothetical protein
MVTNELVTNARGWQCRSGRGRRAGYLRLELVVLAGLALVEANGELETATG